MSAAKLQLSSVESELVLRADLLLTKNRILEKIRTLFGELGSAMEREWHGRRLRDFPAEHRPKLSAGEQYQGLPYVVMDFPREFGKEQVLAIRTLFWWGQYFSTTLHTKGAFADCLAAILRKNPHKLAGREIYLSVNGNEWVHQVNAPHYAEVSQLAPENLETLITQRSFIKLAIKTSLAEWETAGEKLWQNYLWMVSLLDG